MPRAQQGLHQPTAGDFLFFEKGKTINTAVYLDVLKRVVHPWITYMVAGRRYCFQQDGAPAHNSNIVQNWCSNTQDTKEFWPLSSPDLTLLDYYVWGVVEREFNKHVHSTVASLRQAIIDSCVKTDRQHLINSCKRFSARIEAVIAADGGYIE